MKKIVLLIFAILVIPALFLSGGQDDDPFKEYIEHFEETYEIECTTKIYFGELPPNSSETAVAVAVRGGDDVVVNRAKWGYLTYTQKLWVVYHEIGHAMLGLGHSDEGLMITHVPDAWEVKDMFKEYRCDFKDVIDRIKNE